MTASSAAGAPLSGSRSGPGEQTGSPTGTGMRRDVSRIGLLFASVGSIIGSGWLFGAFRAAGQAGPAAIFSWIIGGVMIMFIGLVYAELGAMYPVSGGVVRFPHFTHGSLTSFSVGWITWLAAVTVAPIEVEAALQYATNYLSFLTHVVGGAPVLTPVGYAVAAGFMLLFSFVNVMGVRLFAKLNTPIVWWKLAIIALVIITFLVTSFHPRNLTSHGFMPFHAHGMFEAVATAGIVFSYLGFRQAVELAGETKNPQRNVPFAVLGSVGLCTVIYVGLQIAFLLGIKPSQLANGWGGVSFANDFGPLAGLASLLGLTWLAVLLYADAFISPADTGLIYTTVTARISYAMGRNRNAPVSLAKLSSRGVPWVSVIVTFVAGLIVFLPFPGWQKLVSFITSASVLSFASGPIVLASLRRQLPDQHRPFRLPAANVIAYLAFFSSDMIVYWSGWNTNWKLFTALGIGAVLYAGWYLATRGQIAHPRLDVRPFSWVPVWLAGLVVISYLGNYQGGRGVITFAIAWPVIAVFSLGIFLWGVAVRLPADRVRYNIETMDYEEPEGAAQPHNGGGAAPAPRDIQAPGFQEPGVQEPGVQYDEGLE